MKLCPKCGVEKQYEDFYFRPRGDLQSWCKACMKALRVQRNPQIAEYQRRRRSGRTGEERQAEKNYQLQHNFGITLDDYQELLAAQDYRCAVCGKEDGTDRHKGERTKQLSVDHDHVTSAVRGLLCNDCNRALGQLRDDINLVRALLAYLEDFEERNAKLVSIADEFLDELMKR